MTSKLFTRIAVLAAALLILALPAMGQSESNNTMPSDYPVYKNTGDREADAASFNQALLDWQNANPAEYQNLISGNATVKPTVVEFTKEQFNEFPQERKDYILANPALFKIDGKTPGSKN